MGLAAWRMTAFVLLLAAPFLAAAGEPRLIDLFRSSGAELRFLTLDADFMEQANPVPENGRAEALAKIDSLLHQIFGEGVEVLARDWPYQLEGYETRIKALEYKEYPPTIRFQLELVDSSGRTITSQWRQRWYSLGEVAIEGDILRVDPRYRLSDAGSLGKKINDRRLEFLRKYAPRSGAIIVNTQWVGRYRWANLGYRFISKGAGSASSGEQTRQKFRDDFREFLEKKGVVLTEAELALFREPYHFSAFTNGTQSVIAINDALSLTRRQRETGSLAGKPGEHPLTKAELESGKTKRMAVHLGKEFLLSDGWGREWSGTIKLSEFEGSEAQRFAEAQERLKERAYEVLSPEYQKMIERVRALGVGCERKLVPAQN